MGNPLDGRSKEKFAKDIFSSHIKEARIALRLAISYHAKTKVWPDIIPLGTDFTVKIVPRNKVVAAPDFRIGEFDVEITRSDHECKRYFHWKVHKIDKAIQNQNTHTVFVNGLEDFKAPLYICLNSQQLEEFTNRAKAKYDQCLHPGMVGQRVTTKPAYRYDLAWFESLWKELPILLKKMPDKYRYLTDMVENAKGKKS